MRLARAQKKRWMEIEFVSDRFLYEDRATEMRRPISN